MVFSRNIDPSNPSGAALDLGNSVYPTLPWQCLSEETLKAVGPAT